jgi:hypothetical protein
MAAKAARVSLFIELLATLPVVGAEHVRVVGPVQGGEL